MRLFGKNVKDAGEGVGVVFDSITGLVDKAFTSKEEKAEALQQLKEAQNYIESVVITATTERHRVDMNSDNSLSKNIRPLTLIVLLGTLIVLFLLKAIWDIEVSQVYLGVLQEWGGMAIMFYFGSRALEKTTGLAGSLKNVINRKNK